MDYFSCPICFELFTNAPLIFQCGHVVCENCVVNTCHTCRQDVVSSSPVYHFTIPQHDLVRISTILEWADEDIGRMLEVGHSVIRRRDRMWMLLRGVVRAHIRFKRLISVKYRSVVCVYRIVTMFVARERYRYMNRTFKCLVRCRAMNMYFVSYPSTCTSSLYIPWLFDKNREESIAGIDVAREFYKHFLNTGEVPEGCGGILSAIHTSYAEMEGRMSVKVIQRFIVARSSHIIMKHLERLDDLRTLQSCVRRAIIQDDACNKFYTIEDYVQYILGNEDESVSTEDSEGVKLCSHNCDNDHCCRCSNDSPTDPCPSCSRTRRKHHPHPDEANDPDKRRSFINYIMTEYVVVKRTLFPDEIRFKPSDLDGQTSFTFTCRHRCNSPFLGIMCCNCRSFATSTMNKRRKCPTCRIRFNEWLVSMVHVQD